MGPCIPLSHMRIEAVILICALIDGFTLAFVYLKTFVLIRNNVCVILCVCFNWETVSARKKKRKKERKKERKKKERKKKERRKKERKKEERRKKKEERRKK